MDFQKTVLEKLNKLDRRFDKVDKRLDGVDKRFDEIDERFDKVDERFDKVDERFEKVDERFDEVDERFDKVDERFKAIEDTQDKLIVKMVHVEAALTDVQQDVGILKQSVSRLNDSVDGFATRQLKFDSEMAAVHSRLDRLEPNLEPV